METRSRSTMAVGLGLVFWMFLLFSPLAWVGQARADDAENYGTVIGIVSSFMSSSYLFARRIVPSTGPLLPQRCSSIP